MKLFDAVTRLKAPMAALALCALLTQQMVGFALTVSPAMAYESGFSLCLSGPPPASDDPLDMISGAGFCPCTLQYSVAILPSATSFAAPAFTLIGTRLELVETRNLNAPPTGPPPARAPPVVPYTA